MHADIKIFLYMLSVRTFNQFTVTKDEYSHKKNHAIFIVRHAIF